jgi:hypothetical protein
LLRHSGTVQGTVNVQTITMKTRLINRATKRIKPFRKYGMSRSVGDRTMSNARKYAAIAALGVGLALAAAMPASAQWYGWGGPYYGYGYAPYHPYYGYGYAPAYPYVFYHRPYYADGYGYYPRHHYYGYHPYDGYYHRRYHGYGYHYYRYAY